MIGYRLAELIRLSVNMHRKCYLADLHTVPFHLSRWEAIYALLQLLRLSRPSPQSNDSRSEHGVMNTENGGQGSNNNEPINIAYQGFSG